MLRLEAEFPTQYNDSVTKVIQVPSEVSAVQIVHRNTIAVLIERIEEVGADLQPPIFTHSEVLRKAQIGIVEAGRAESVATQATVAETVSNRQTSAAIARHDERIARGSKAAKISRHGIENDLPVGIKVWTVATSTVAV